MLYHNTEPKDFDDSDFEKINSMVEDKYRKAITKYRIYLTDPQFEDMEQVLRRFRATVDHMRYIKKEGEAPTGDDVDKWHIDYKDFKEAYENATEILRKKLIRLSKNLKNEIFIFILTSEFHIFIIQDYFIGLDLIVIVL